MASPARASSLADAIAAHAPLHCLGVYDSVSLAAAERAGASALYASGLALSASVLGLPDAGLMTQTEMHDAIARLVGQTDLPLVADADAGYGDAGNAARTMRLWERAGVAALHIEDQAFPKHCATPVRNGRCPHRSLLLDHRAHRRHARRAAGQRAAALPALRRGRR
jgi:2-methylisocitrate lyase-like PEP mutase family enzyme